MLVGNRSVLNKSPGRFLSGTPGTLRSTFNKPGMMQNTFENYDSTAAIPYGHLSPSAWFLPRLSGGMSSVNVIVGTGSFTGSGALGLNAESSLLGTGEVTYAEMQLVVSALASLVGSGTLSSATLLGKLEAAAALAGSGNIAGAIGALAGMLASLNGFGTVSSATPYATGQMSANIRGYSDLTPEGLRDSVWNALVESYGADGTMGKALGDVGAGSNPWDAVIESGFTAKEILQILAAVAAGKTDIVDLGGGSATVTFRDLADTKDRLEAGLTGSERTSTTIDTDP